MVVTKALILSNDFFIDTDDKGKLSQAIQAFYEMIITYKEFNKNFDSDDVKDVKDFVNHCIMPETRKSLVKSDVSLLSDILSEYSGKKVRF